MLKYAKLIEQMTDEQKLALVADFTSAINVPLPDFPHAQATTTDAIVAESTTEASFPSYASIANSWNTKVMDGVIRDIVTREGAEKFAVIYTPPASVRSNPYAPGMSEDPYLVTQMLGSAISAIESNGAASCLDKCGVRPIDLEFSDSKPFEPAISNVLLRPTESALRSGKPSAARLPFTRLRGEWQKVNAQSIDRFLKKNYIKTIIASEIYEEATRGKLETEKLIFSGAPIGALRSALKNYRRMKEDVERGSITVYELNSAVAVGTAISDVTLNTAVDKVLGFISSAARVRKTRAKDSPDEKAKKSAAAQTVALQAAEESVVMLKNVGVLPFPRGAKLAVMGELAGSFVGFDGAVGRVCSTNGLTYVGRVDGYRTDEDRSDDLLTDATLLAERADMIVVVVGLGEQREARLTETKKLALPANQAALIDAMAQTGKQVAVVAVGDYLPDTSFDKNVGALLFAPGKGTRTAEALANILVGAVNPSGKLAATGYQRVDEKFAEHKANIAAGRYKMGEFMGYRRYTTENTPVKYPFGFGLSYTNFEYSEFKVTASNAEVTVKNTGTRPGAEVVQMYIGKRSSSLVRPDRELKGFAKVQLAPGASIQIRFPINPVMLEVYDPEDGKRKTEGGAYKVCIASSSTDIRFTGEIDISGEAIKRTEDRASDFLPSITNIVTDGYKLNKLVGDKQQDAFKSARAAENFSFEKLFEDEFDAVKEEDSEYDSADEADITEYLDESVTIPTISAGIVEFSRSRGLRLDPPVVREILSAFAASRAVLVSCEADTYAELVRVLCEYFGCPCGIDNAAEYKDFDDLFLLEGKDTELLHAVSYALGHRDRVAIAALDMVEPARIGEIFAPFIRYATAPSDLTLTIGSGRRTITVSPNLWFIMRIDPAKTVFPAYLADMASVIHPDGTRVQAGADPAVHTPNYYQLVSAINSAERKYEIDESCWKKVDKLERYVAARTPFFVDNKMCVQMEKYIAAFLACGGENAEALDSVVAAKLIPHILTAIQGKLQDDDLDFAQTIDGIFGEDEAPRCKRAVRHVKV